MRAIAVLTVVLWHANVSLLPGGFVGVDVFFVISGYLMTRLLYRQLSNSGSVNVLDFFRRRIKRLLPAASVVLVFICLASRLILPSHRQISVGLDVLCAALYISNWRFAETSVNYLAMDAAPSPVQHFWSLSVEEQFYLVWPFLILLVAVVIRGSRRSPRTATTVLLVAIIVGSLIWSAVLTPVDAGRAYFVTTTRLWELALGGLVLLMAHFLVKTPRQLAAVLSWAGLVMVLGSAALLRTVRFPGLIALIPTLGCALVLGFADRAGLRGPYRVLSMRPMVWFGGLSYSLYLWHWPVIVFGAELLSVGSANLTAVQGIGLAALSVVPAWLSLRFVENPLRRARWLAKDNNAFFFMVMALSVQLSAGAVLVASSRAAAMIIPDSGGMAYSSAGPTPKTVVAPKGAEVLGTDPLNSPEGKPVDKVPTIAPDPSRANSDTPLGDPRCHHTREDRTVHPCAFGDLQAQKRVALIGDSHAAQWVPALDGVGKSRGWNITVYTKSACPFIAGDLRYSDGSDYVQCSDWNRKVFDEITGPNRPDIVLISHSNYVQYVTGGGPAVRKASLEYLSKVQASGAKVVIIRDTPFLPGNVAECAAQNRGALTKCAFAKSVSLGRRDNTQPDTANQLNIPIVDLTDYVCPAANCAPVIGGVLVWRDSNHLTGTYARTLIRPMDAAFAGII